MTHIKYYIFIAGFLLWSPFLFAQEMELPQNLSLKQAQEIALKQNPKLQVKTLNQAISQKQIEKAKWKKIPQLYANFDMRRNLIIPTTPVPAKAFNPNATSGEIMPLKFMTNWTSNAGLNFKMDIFNPKTHGNVEEKQQEATIKATEKKISANDLLFQVSKDYAAVIIAKKQWELALSDTVNKSKVLKNIREKYQAGRLKSTALNQMISQKNASVSHFLKAQKIWVSAKAQLITDMGFNPSTNHAFMLSDSLSSLLSSSPNQNTNHSNSLSLKKWQQQKQLTQIQLHHARQGYLPTLSLKGFYGGNYYDNDFAFFKGENWYGNSYIGLSLNIPITQGIDRVKKIAILRLQNKANQASYKAQQNQRQLSITKAKQDILYRQKDLLNKKKAMRLSKANFKTTQEQFMNGRLLFKNYNESSFSYQQAKTNYLQAAYELVIAEMKLAKVKKE